ncbi:MAG: hypothetical protein AMXMBFR82_50650 [Candidatus Hydrogenedentota bacterium]
MFQLLRAHDTGLVELDCGDCGVLVCPGLQGRIFCRIENDLVHRLDIVALESPSRTGFNNLGGNSLWPAPEGGPFGFNYLPGSNDWVVQEGIAEVPALVTHREAAKAVLEKQINLINRKGVAIAMTFRRVVSVHGTDGPPEGFDLAGLTYRTEDTFELSGSYHPEDVLLAPWSLEQFPGAEGVTAFCKVDAPKDAINGDFYGSPKERIAYGKDFFTFALGGEARQQIGVKVAANPALIGAIDSSRSLLMLRKTAPQDGIYFNIADNDQPRGPYSASDLYSIFNGGELNFFELETIGAMNVVDGKLAPSTLVSETTLLKGDSNELKRYLAECEGLRLEECLPE